MVTSSNLLSDTILFIRNTLRSNITDPISTSRPSNEKFVMTSYPRRKVRYPLITVKSINITDTKLGQQSEKALVNFTIEVRIWARNEKERAELFDDVYTHMRTNQFPSATAGTSLKEQLFDYGLNSAVDVDEEGEEGIKSKVLEYRYAFIA